VTRTSRQRSRCSGWIRRWTKWAPTSGTWTRSGLSRACSPRPRVRGHPLRVFLDGRPIFGKQIKTGWSYYGFLERAEVDELRRTVVAARDGITAMPEPPKLPPEEAERLRNDLKAALEQISDDEAMRAFFARLVKEAVMLGDRPVKDLAFAAAKRRGGLTAPHVVPDYKAFLGRFNAARSRATPHRLLPFLAEFDGWLGRISGAGRDLFFFTA